MRSKHLLLTLITSLLFTSPVYSFSCSVSTQNITYDLSPLTGLRTANRRTPTPPTTSEAIVRMDLCRNSGVPPEYGGIPEEDEVGHHPFSIK